MDEVAWADIEAWLATLPVEPETLYRIGGVLLLILAGLVLHALIFRAIARYAHVGEDRHAARFAASLKWPTRLLVLAVVAANAVALLDLPAGLNMPLRRLGYVLAIAAFAWGLVRVIHALQTRAERHFRTDVADNLTARKMRTQIAVLSRVAVAVVLLISAAIILASIPAVREFGVSLLASAGIAGIVVGMAARPALANLIAGVQIALAQPIRIDDVVIVEGEWGWVEEIFATYVVVRIWDWRRMVVPLSYFIERPFQNWTRESAAVIGSVFWYVDYTVPVDAVRAKMEEFVHESPLWDGNVVVLQVTDTDKDTMTLRGLMSARNSPRSWDLRCEIRERLLVWLQAEYPGALPRLRGELEMKGEGRDGEWRDGAAPEGA